MTEIENAAAELAVRGLIARYAHALDGRDRAGFLALFADDAVVTLNGAEYAGMAAIAGWYDLMAKGVPGIHMTTNTAVNVAGATATARSDFLLVRKAEEGWKTLFGGRYADALENRGGCWLFTRRDLTFA